MPTFLSLFSGIGGLDLGLERAGWTCVGQVEIEPFCRQVLAEHWPGVPRWDDIRTVDTDGLPRADLVAGGFPCQPVSQAGRKQGFSDHRWLWPEFARVVRDLRPRWVLVENVRNLLSIEGGRATQAVLGDLSALGFDAEWFCLSACAVGAPHMRHRLFIVAHTQRPGLEVGQFQPAGDELPAAERSGDERGWWDIEPPLGRVVAGVPRRVVRPQLTALGNAVVPQVAEAVGRRIMGLR